MHHERRNMNENNSNDLQTIITQVIEEMKSEQGDKFDINRINLAGNGTPYRNDKSTATTIKKE